jgi:hypothetical protein
LACYHRRDGIEFGSARLLIHHSYPVVTNLDGQSAVTRKQVDGTGFNVVSTPEVILLSHIILSIVPPRGALALDNIVAVTAKNVLPADLTRKIAYVDINAM